NPASYRVVRTKSYLFNKAEPISRTAQKVSPGWETFVIVNALFYRRWDLMLKKVNMKNMFYL
ncbi:hypothetical protein QIG47_15820, partial [Klebsiella pneumoniae]|nr:hypothetical protein [Klebsiella pneumoniae]